MKKLVATMMMVAMMACNGVEQKKESTIIGKQVVDIESRQMTPEILWAFGRVGNVSVSPDGERIAYTVTHYDISENRSNADIYIMDVDGGNKKQLTQTATREGALAWLPSGEAIAFLREGVLWIINPDTGKENQVSDIKDKIEGFVYSPAGDKILFVIPTKVEKYNGAEIHADLSKANVYIYDDLMYRHWDTWKDGTYNHIYVGVIDAGKVSIVEDIMSDEPHDAPLKPFGGTEEIAWNPDGKTIVYTCKKLTGKAYAFQTNSNLYAYNLDNKQTRLLTPNMPGYDNNPQFSPDGSKLLWTSMRRAGFEADKERIMIMDWPSGAKRDVSTMLDASPSAIKWSADGRTLYLTAPYQEAHQIHKLDISTSHISRMTDGNHDYQGVQIAGDVLIATRATSVCPAEIYRVSMTDGKGEDISLINKELIDKLNVPSVEKRFVTTTDNKQMVTWVVYPPNFDKSKKYPVLLMCTGGPQGVLGPSFSYRWSYMLMASQGYIVVVPARRGTSGSGQEWCDAISTNHGTQDEADLLSAIDEISKEPFVDRQRIGAMGASYGGYSVFHLAGTHNGRFSAFFAHCGIFNTEFKYATTEEMFFAEWENGGAPWETNNKTAQTSFSHSPHLLVNNWDTPIMVVHGEKDYRIPYTQGMAAFNLHYS